jgi:hypothetical protein
MGRQWLGIDINAEFLKSAERRIAEDNRAAGAAHRDALATYEGREWRRGEVDSAAGSEA